MQALFLGAGASYECGLPLTDELDTELCLWLTRERLQAYNKGWKEDGHGWSDAVLQQIYNWHANKDSHYENLLENLKHISQRNNASEWQDVQSFILQAVYGLLLERQIKNARYAQVSLRDFKGIKSLAEDHKPLWVFTSNQDCLVEMLAAEYFIPLKTGLRDGTELFVGDGAELGKPLDFSTISAEAVAQGEWDFFQPGEYGINLVKLNGSLDLFAQPNHDQAPDYIKLMSNSKTADHYLDALLYLNQVNHNRVVAHGGLTDNSSLSLDEQGSERRWYKTLLTGIQSQPQPELLPDTAPLFACAAQALLGIDTLHVLGHGFNDPRINQLFADWLSADSERRLRTVDMQNTNVPAALKAHRKQVLPARRTAMASEFFLGVEGDPGGFMQRFQRNMRAKTRAGLRTRLIEQR